MWSSVERGASLVPVVMGGPSCWGLLEAQPQPLFVQETLALCFGFYSRAEIILIAVILIRCVFQPSLCLQSPRVGKGSGSSS